MRIRVGVVLATALVGGLAVVGPRSSEAFTYGYAATGGTIAWNANGVAGTVGAFAPTKIGEGASVTASYGHLVHGATCEGADDKQCTNFMMVQASWEPQDPTTSQFVHSVLERTYGLRVLDSQDADCPLPYGPPTWSTTARVTASPPVPGNQGSDDVALDTGNIGASHTPPQTVSPSPVQPDSDQALDEWVIDPEDPATTSFRISTKIVSKLSGGGKEITVGVDQLYVQFQLSIEVAGG